MFAGEPQEVFDIYFDNELYIYDIIGRRIPEVYKLTLSSNWLRRKEKYFYDAVTNQSLMWMQKRKSDLSSRRK